MCGGFRSVWNLAAGGRRAYRCGRVGGAPIAPATGAPMGGARRVVPAVNFRPSLQLRRRQLRPSAALNHEASRGDSQLRRNALPQHRCRHILEGGNFARALPAWPSFPAFPCPTSSSSSSSSPVRNVRRLLPAMIRLDEGCRIVSAAAGEAGVGMLLRRTRT
jgi:hypothetical protein